MTHKLIDWYQKIAVIVLNTAILLVVANMVCGVVFALRDANDTDNGAAATILSRYPEDTFRTAYPDLTWAEIEALLIENWARPFACDDLLGFREAAYTGDYVHVHLAGFRWGAVEPPWPPRDDALNIFVFGGSTTFGYGVADAGTLPAQMQGILDARAADQPVQVYNFGQGAYYSTQERLLFEQLLLDGIRPDIVVFVDGLNDGMVGPDDVLRLPGSGFGCGDTAVVEERDALTIHLPLIRAARAVRAWLDAKLSQDATDTPPVSPANDGTPLAEAEIFAMRLDHWQTNRLLIRALAEKFDIATVFVWQPVPDYHADLACHLFMTRAHSHMTRFYEAMAAREAAWHTWDDFLYLADVQQGRCALDYVDQRHYSPAFHAVLAQHIVDFLVQRDLLGE